MQIEIKHFLMTEYVYIAKGILLFFLGWGLKNVIFESNLSATCLFVVSIKRKKYIETNILFQLLVDLLDLYMKSAVSQVLTKKCEF